MQSRKQYRIDKGADSFGMDINIFFLKNKKELLIDLYEPTFQNQALNCQNYLFKHEMIIVIKGSKTSKAEKNLPKLLPCFFTA